MYNFAIIFCCNHGTCHHQRLSFLLLHTIWCTKKSLQWHESRDVCDRIVLHWDRPNAVANDRRFTFVFYAFLYHSNSEFNSLALFTKVEIKWKAIVIAMGITARRIDTLTSRLKRNELHCNCKSLIHCTWRWVKFMSLCGRHFRFRLESAFGILISLWFRWKVMHLAHFVFCSCLHPQCNA